MSAVVSWVSLWNLAREIGARAAQMYPRAHARRLTVHYHLSRAQEARITCANRPLSHAATTHEILHASQSSIQGEKSPLKLFYTH